jgi:hypothetical protein
MEEPEDLSSAAAELVKETPKKVKEERDNGESAEKRRKLEDGRALDQFRHSFGIKVPYLA